MPQRWPGAAKRGPCAVGDHPSMQTRYVDGLTIRPLRNGDTETVAVLFERLGARSRERRFCGAKPRLSDPELARPGSRRRKPPRARGVRHRGPRPPSAWRVSSVTGRPRRSPSRSPTPTRDAAWALFWRGKLTADARAAGITTLVATVCGDNPRVVSLLTRVAELLHVRWHGGEREIVVRLGSSS